MTVLYKKVEGTNATAICSPAPIITARGFAILQIIGCLDRLAIQSPTQHQCPRRILRYRCTTLPHPSFIGTSLTACTTMFARRRICRGVVAVEKTMKSPMPAPLPLRSMTRTSIAPCASIAVTTSSTVRFTLMRLVGVHDPHGCVWWKRQQYETIARARDFLVVVAEKSGTVESRQRQRALCHAPKLTVDAITAHDSSIPCMKMSRLYPLAVG